MAAAARKALLETSPVPSTMPAPRLADDEDRGAPSAVHDQQRALEDAFTARHGYPRLRAATFAGLIVGSIGLWAAIIAAAIQVGHMVSP